MHGYSPFSTMQQPTGLRPVVGPGASPPGPTVTFEVGNTRTKVWGADPVLQHTLWSEMAYSTQTADALADGWKPPEAGFGEAYWDGWVRLTKWSQTTGIGHIPTGLLEQAVSRARQLGHAVHVADARKRPLEGVPDFPAIPLRDYQQKAVEAALLRGRGVLDMPPRAGKTRTGIELTRSLWLPTLWIAPTTNIVDQTVRAFDELCGKNFAVQVKGAKTWRDLSHVRVHVMTAATAALLPEEYFQTREVLLIDEVHHGASPQYHAIAEKCEHIYFRFGMSGTFFRSGNDEIALHALLSETIFRITTSELRDRGYLVPFNTVFLPVEGPAVPKKFAKSNGPGGWMVGVGKHGVFEHEYRNRLAAWAASMLVHSGKKVLVLVGTKPQGDAITEFILETIGRPVRTEFAPVEFVSTNRTPQTCRRIIDAFVGTDEIKVLVGTSMVGEGTDLPSADALVYAPGGMAEVGHRQAQFRVCTALPGKRRAIIVDFADRHHPTLLKHALERADTYCTEPIAEVHALSTPEEFAAWLEWFRTSRVFTE